MQNYIKAIPTEYNGITFRSKLEANYAKLFDYFNMNWMYEVEGYRFQDGTWYLPDFYFPDQDLFVEVKGIMNKLDEHKINLLNQIKPVIVGFSDGGLRWYHYTRYDHVDDTCVEMKYDQVGISMCPYCRKFQFRMISPSNCGIPNKLNWDYFFPQPITDENLLGWSEAPVDTTKCLICGKTFTDTPLGENSLFCYNIKEIQYLFKRHFNF